MKIQSISIKIPSFEISNEYVIESIAIHNQDQPAHIVARYQRELSYLLKRSGANTRYLRDREKGETAIRLIKAAIHEALEKAELKTTDIDLLIYCGVGRGFLEPANAYFCAQAVGMACNCFDISDACMSWVRSLEVAYALLNFSNYKNILVVNGEFTAYEYGYPEIFKLQSPSQIAYTFPAYTIGEGASATILTKSSDEWTFDFESAPEFANLCSIPLSGYDDFCEKGENIGLKGVNGFVSFGGELFDIAVERMVDLAQSRILDIDGVDLWFPHGAASDPCWRAAEILNIEESRFFSDSFPVYGNLISASIPAAMHMAISDGRLRRGQKVILCPASAGMSFAIVQLIY